MRRRIGAAALDMDAASDASWQTQWRATVAARLPSQLWPQRAVFITAVDAHTGEPVVFDRHSGVDLVDAVAASCSSGVAYRIGGSRYIDGGYRSNAENADLAAGCAGVGAITIWRQITDSGELGHASRNTGRRATRTRQQSRDDLPGQQLRAHVRRRCDGSVAASARCWSRLRPGQSPCRAAHRILALTPTKPIDSVGVTTSAHASEADGRDMSHAIFLPPDLGSCFRLDELGLQVQHARTDNQVAPRLCG